MISLDPIPPDGDRAPDPAVLPLKNAIRIVQQYHGVDYRVHPSIRSAVRRLLDFAKAEERVHVRCLRRVRSLRAEVQLARLQGEVDDPAYAIGGSDEALRVLDALEDELLRIDRALDTH